MYLKRKGNYRLKESNNSEQIKEILTIVIIVQCLSIEKEDSNGIKLYSIVKNCLTKSSIQLIQNNFINSYRKLKSQSTKTNTMNNKKMFIQEIIIKRQTQSTDKETFQSRMSMVINRNRKDEEERKERRGTKSYKKFICKDQLKKQIPKRRLSTHHQNHLNMNFDISFIICMIRISSSYIVGQ